MNGFNINGKKMQRSNVQFLKSMDLTHKLKMVCYKVYLYLAEFHELLIDDKNT